MFQSIKDYILGFIMAGIVCVIMCALFLLPYVYLSLLILTPITCILLKGFSINSFSLSNRTIKHAGFYLTVLCGLILFFSRQRASAFICEKIMAGQTKSYSYTTKWENGETTETEKVFTPYDASQKDAKSILDLFLLISCFIFPIWSYYIMANHDEKYATS